MFKILKYLHDSDTQEGKISKKSLSKYPFFAPYACFHGPRPSFIRTAELHIENPTTQKAPSTRMTARYTNYEQSTVPQGVHKLPAQET